MGYRKTHKSWGSLFALLVGVSTLLVTAVGLTDLVSAAPPPTTMNFQGRLRSNAGTMMPDGLYNMQFRIFTVSSGGTAVWNETRQTTSRVQVTNGLFSVQLGEVTPLSASVFNTTNLYFEITMPTPATATCSTVGCASWEAPMTPRNKLATSAFAFNAATLNGKSDTDFAAASGSANYIQNGTSPQTASFNVSGSGTVGTTLTVGGSTTINNTALIKSTSATAFQIQNASSTPLLVADSSSGTVTIGSAGNTITLSSNGISLAGNARNLTTVTLAPEYPGATFTGDGSNNTGSLSSDFCSDALGINAGTCTGATKNYYEWIATDLNAQDYDIYVRYRIPSNYSTGSLTNLKIEGYSQSNAAEDLVTLSLFANNSSTACSASTNAASVSGWSEAIVASPLGSCTINANDMVTFRVRLAATEDGFVRAGAISFDYRETR